MERGGRGREGKYGEGRPGQGGADAIHNNTKGIFEEELGEKCVPEPRPSSE